MTNHPQRTTIWRALLGSLLLCPTSTLFAEAARRVEPDLVALAKVALVSLPPPPPWRAATGPNGLCTLEDVTAEFARSTDRVPQLNHGQTHFVRPDHKWLAAFSDWFTRVEKQLKLTYKDEVWDCDNFAQCFVAFADLVALRAREARASICIGWATVTNARGFGGIGGGGGGHAVVVVVTTEGLFVIEPQSGKMTPIRNYPNRDEFVEVYL